MKLLLAEDEEALSRPLVVILQHADYEVDAVYDGAAALEAASGQYYDGIIMDIMMPEMSGLEVLRRLREQNITTPVLLLTAKAEIDDRVDGLDAGADDYLTKPFAMKELLARVRAMLRHKENTLAELVSLGNITLHRTDRELAGPTSSMRLSGPEFDFLALLVSNPGKILTADQIIARVWPDEADADRDLIVFYSSYLKNKLTAVNADLTVAETGGGWSLLPL